MQPVETCGSVTKYDQNVTGLMHEILFKREFGGHSEMTELNLAGTVKLLN